MDRDTARTAVRIAIQAELSHRGWNITQLRDETGIDNGTLGDFLSGQRWPQLRTLGRIEKAVEWPPGTIATMLAGGPSPTVGAPADDAEHEELLYRRPEGLSDQEWERIKIEAGRFIEWQIDKAAQER